jgi:pimeloyl-ACP methyl ester carboxylesterase
MNEIELSAGTVQYVDSGTGGPVVVLLHGLLMDASLWDGVIADLSADHRCIAPTLPFGAHRRPMNTGADLSLRGIADLVVEFLDRLDLQDVVLVGNDTGGAVVQLVLGAEPKRVAQAVLASCEAFDNLPPGLTGRVLALSGRLSPRLFGAFMQQLRLKAVRRSPLAFGTLTKQRAETVRMLRAVFADPELLTEAAEDLRRFDRPALIVWAADDRVMPIDHGRRLAELLPQAKFVEVADSYTLIPLDQPSEFAGLIRALCASAAR